MTDWSGKTCTKGIERCLRANLDSVPSSQWGDYKGTLIGVSHLDLINWTNRLKWWFWELSGSKRKYVLRAGYAKF